MASGAVQLTMQGLARWHADMAAAHTALVRAMRQRIREAGKHVQGKMQGQFAGQLTDPTTKRRTDKSDRLGTFTGRGKRAIGVRVFVEGLTTWWCYVGPPGGIGIAKPGFHLAFHELGIYPYPQRSIVPPAVKESEQHVYQVLGKVLQVLR